jgi:hypothetical protein
MIFGFIFTLKKGKGELCCKKTTEFTLMLQGERGARLEREPGKGQIVLLYL